MIGTTIQVVKGFEMRRGDKADAPLIARFVPGLTYRVTEKNKATIEKALAEGDAIPFAIAPSASKSEGMNVVASGSRPSGKMSSREKVSISKSDVGTMKGIV